MKKRTKLVLVLLLITIFMSAIGITSLAASKTFKPKVKGNSVWLIASVTCDYSAFWKDSFTITNNGTTNLIVYRNNCYADTLSPGESYTSPRTFRDKDYVKIYENNGRASQKNNFKITTTSGKIK